MNNFNRITKKIKNNRIKKKETIKKTEIADVTETRAKMADASEIPVKMAAAGVTEILVDIGIETQAETETERIVIRREASAIEKKRSVNGRVAIGEKRRNLS